MDDSLQERIAAVERALTDGEHDLAALATEGDVAARVETAEDDIEDLTDRVAELEAATQALRGYVGNVRAVNEDVRERADLALETARAADDSPADSGPVTTERATDERDERSLQQGGRSPTLELEADRATDDTEPPNRPSENRCPLCDGDNDTLSDQTRSGDTSRQDQQASDSHRGLTDGGLTDGGLVRDDGRSPETADAGVLTRIRSLL